MVTLEDVKEFLDNMYYPTDRNKILTGFASIDRAQEGDLTFWLEPHKKMPEMKATGIVVPMGYATIDDGTGYIMSQNPKLDFVRIVNHFFPNQIPDFSQYIEEYKPIIFQEAVTIGNNVKIGPGACIGYEGFGYVQDKDGSWLHFPHCAGVVLEDNVEIGANTCIDRGSLKNTIIGEGTKIDNLVHIGHSDVIGKNCLIVAQTVIGGSVKIGDGCFISMGVSIMDNITIGENSLIGMGAVVTRDIPPNSVAYGNPAKHREHNGIEKLLNWKTKM